MIEGAGGTELADPAESAERAERVAGLRELRLSALANQVVDAVHAKCDGEPTEMAFVLSLALASVVRSWPHRASREVLAKLLFSALWTTCDGLPGS